MIKKFLLKIFHKKNKFTSKDKKIDRPAVRFHQGNITEPLGTITTKKNNEI